MKLNELKSIKNKGKKRVGRGIAAGGGKTAGRGTKGQKSRSGYNIPTKFEGGQTPLNMRLHKLPGFKTHKEKVEIISFNDINRYYKDGETLSVETLIKKGILSRDKSVKVLANGELKVQIKISGIKISKKAQDILEKYKKTSSN